MSLFDGSTLWQAWDLALRILRFHGLAIVLATWLCTAAGCAIAYHQHLVGATWSLSGWLRFCFPREILTQPSCRLDLAYSVIRVFLHKLFLTSIIATHLGVAAGVYLGLRALFGPRAQGELGLAGWLVLVTLCVITDDCVNFHVHYLEHKLRALWEVHKVHHSTEFLLPISNNRIHPLQELLDRGASSAAVGILLGVASYVLQLHVRDGLVIGLDAYFVGNALSFHHLRHSYIRLSYGRLERFLMSPTQHQIHHSCDEHLWDRNFGLLLAVWDQLYGTIVYSHEAPVFRVGLPAAYRGEYDSVPKLFLTPVRNLARMARRAG